MDLSHISEQLSDLPMWAIAAFVFVASAIRLTLVRVGRAHAFVETIDAILVAVVLVFMIIQPFLMKSFYIPSGSMRETLLEDDHIFCNKIDYRIGSPQRGDIVIFIPPVNALQQSPEGYHPEDGPVYYIKRLVGLPGDVIETHMGYITVNGRALAHEDIRDSLGLTDRDAQHVKIESSDIRIFDGTWKTYDAQQIAQQFSEPGATVTFHPGVTIRNGVVLDEPYTAEDPEYNFKIVGGKSVFWSDDGNDPDEVMVDGIPDHTDVQALVHAPAEPVPAGHVLVMGDNRNDSGDATHWGPLEENRLTGKAVAIFYPFTRIRSIQ
jgi:signal peptidase I